MKKIILVALTALVSIGVNAQIKRSEIQLNTITTAVPFLLIAPDSRHGALGDAGVASSPDANSMHWNAAKLVFAEKDMGISISYSPWLRDLVPDINLSYVGFYKKIGQNKDQAIGASLRYFSLGDIKFTNEVGDPIGDFNPNEFAIDAAYSRKLSERFSMALSGRYIFSNLTGGIDVAGANTKAGTSFAADVSAFYTNPDAVLFGEDVIFNLGINISNIGAKISYTDDAIKDFIPINLKIGQALTYEIDDYNALTFLTDFNKLLVPTPPVFATDDSGLPIFDPVTGEREIESGKNPDVNIVSGMFQSFSDAPDGFSEELKEFNISAGIEYWYDKKFAVRFGYFHEHETKGNRKFFTTGAGLKLSVFSIDFSYLFSTVARNPLANTLRFSLKFDFDDFKKQNDEAPTN